jgi:hypothetical protein
MRRSQTLTATLDRPWRRPSLGVLAGAVALAFVAAGAVAWRLGLGALPLQSAALLLALLVLLLLGLPRKR